MKTLLIRNTINKRQRSEAGRVGVNERVARKAAAAQVQACFINKT